MHFAALLAPLALVFPLLNSGTAPLHDPNPPTWTNGEFVSWLLTILVSVVVPVGVGMWRFFQYLARRDVERLDEENQKLDRRAKAAEKELEQVKEERLPRKAEFEQVQKQLGEVEAHAKELETTNAQSADQAATRERILREMQEGLGRLRQELGDYDQKIRATANRVRRALKLEGLLWEEKVLHNAPKFTPLQERRKPIVSLLNLKGGVGKTTVTANLGAALAHLGYRVLLVDLDLQGSLTNLFLPEGKQQQLYQNRQLLQNFFEQSADDITTKLLDTYRQPILGNRSALVATADTLAYTELNLTFKWLLRIGKRDPRFLLRKALHLKQVTSQFDIMLLDCPPLMNVSCVNALGASDYVLVPVMPSKQVAGRVPVLLRNLRSFRDNINTELKILGVLANRTQRAALTNDESNLWSGLAKACQNEWGEPVPMCETIIRQSATIRDTEDAHRPLQEGDEMFPCFVALAEEIERRLPAFSVLPGRPTQGKGVTL